MSKKELGEKELKNKLAEESARREKQCVKEFSEMLKKNKCSVEISMVISQNFNKPQITFKAV